MSASHPDNDALNDSLATLLATLMTSFLVSSMVLLKLPPFSFDIAVIRHGISAEIYPWALSDRVDES